MGQNQHIEDPQEPFQRPAALDRSRLSIEGREYHSPDLSDEVRIEVISNAEIVQKILDGNFKPREIQEKDFDESFKNLRRLSLKTKEEVFDHAFDVYKKNPNFLRYIQKRLVNQKIRYACFKDQIKSIWTIVNCDDVVAFPDNDPLVDIQEDGSDDTFSLPLFDAFKNMVLS